MGRIDDGHSTTVTFADFPTVKFYEKTVTPPGVEGGGENDTTTMLNTIWRTRSPKKLKTLSEGSLNAAYDTEVYSTIITMIQTNQLITVNFADGSKYAFWGWVDSFVPGEIVEGEQPEAEVVIIPSNTDAAGAEIAPVWTPAP